MMSFLARVIERPRVVVGALLLLFVALFNPLGLDDASDRSSESVLLRLMAPFYPSSGQQQVVVVLIDDQALGRLNANWPMSYGQQARVLRQILHYEPKTLFVDLLYSQRRIEGGPVAPLQQALASYGRREVPVFLADYPDDHGRSLVLPELQAEAQLALVSWSGYGRRYPLMVPGAGGERLTPALLQYLSDCPEAMCSRAVFSEPMVTLWGFWIDPALAKVADLGGCTRRGERSAPAQTLSLLTTDLLRNLKDEDQVERPQPCAYTRTIYADQLRDPQVGQFLRGKHVLLGAHIRGIPDLVDSPVHGQLPGVYLHAMALDNLISQGADYWRPAQELAWGRTLVDWIETVLLLAAVLVALLLPAHNAPARPQPARLCGSYFIWLVLLSVTALLISIFLARWLHIAPVDWLGLVMMIGLFYGYLGEPSFPAVRGWISKWRAR